MSCNFTSPDTIQYINNSGKYVLKCKGWKKHRISDIQLTKIKTSIIREENNNKKEKLQTKLNEIIIQFKKNFKQRLNSPNSSTAQEQKRILRDKIEKIINKLHTLEYELINIGKFKPTNIVYRRKIKS